LYCNNKKMASVFGFLCSSVIGCITAATQINNDTQKVLLGIGAFLFGLILLFLWVLDGLYLKTLVGTKMMYLGCGNRDTFCIRIRTPKDQEEITSALLSV